MAKKKQKPKGRTQGKAKDVLSPAQEKFCQAYVLNGDNGTAAYKAVKPNVTDNVAGVMANRWLKNVKVQLRISVLRIKVVATVEKHFEISAERIVQEMAAIAFQNAGDYFDWGSETVTLTRKDQSQYVVTRPYMNFKSSNELTPIQKLAVAGVEKTISKTGDIVVNVKLHDKRSALKDLHAMAGYTKATEVTGKNGAPITVAFAAVEADL